ncbi:glucan endo-1,3-beta-glucosidase 12-like [Euphorbia lathyris]|uniref:glucan endo-1,3-beta-glucosidase 12-like n=1 Tax=Euphorbia lathyris TaxID=212925 RepID=UPI00331411B9
MEPLFKFRLSILHFLTFLLFTDARFFNVDENLKYLEALDTLPPTNTNPYGLPSPLSPPPLPSLPPLPSPVLTPPFTPPSTPSLMVPPPPSFTFPIKTPPVSFTPKPTTPPSVVPGPSPPGTVPGVSPPSVVPGPSPPAGASPPPPHKKAQSGLWCVAKPTVPDLVIQGALDYACGSGADCKSIQPNGPCFQPNTLVGHASYAFNSYWQSTKESGGTCDFGGTAMLVTADPSYSKCNFIFK